MTDEIRIEGEPRKPLRIGTVATVDAETGEVTEVRRNAGTLLPPPPGVCQECAVAHAFNQPHDKDSLYYQMSFHATHGRWPVWSDALRHCPPAVQAAWREQLIKRFGELGREIPDDLMEPRPPGR